MHRIPCPGGSLNLLDDHLVATAGSTSVSIPKDVFTDCAEGAFTSDTDEMIVQYQHVDRRVDWRCAPYAMLYVRTEDVMASLQIDGYGVRCLTEWAEAA